MEMKAMGEPRFKVGDRVVLLHDMYSDLKEGATGVVQEADRVPYVDWAEVGYDSGHDGCTGDGRKSVASVPEDSLALASEISPSTSDAERILALLIAAGHLKQVHVDAARALLAVL